MASHDETPPAPPAWSLPPLEPGHGEVPPGLAPAQQRIWLLEQLDPGNLFFRLARLGRIRGPLNAPALALAVEVLGRRHAALRTSFPVDGTGAPRPRVAPEPERLLTVDLAGLPPAAREEALGRWLVEESGGRLDAARGPVFRVALARLGAQDHALSLSVHHLVADGWAMLLLLDELKRLYGRISRGEPPELEPITLTYADYVAWRAAWPEAMVTEQLRYWQRQLAGLPPPVELPGDRVAPTGVETGELRRTLPDALAARLRGWSRTHRATLVTLMTAIVGTIIHRYVGAEDLVIACPVAGRRHGETNRVVGCFVNTILVRLRVARDLRFLDHVGAVGQTIRAGEAHQDVAFERVLEWLRAQQGGGRALPFAVMVNPLPDAYGITLPGLEVESLERHGLESPLPFELYVAVTDQIILRVRYQRHRYSQACVARYLDQIEHLLRQVLDDPTRTLGEYSLRVDDGQAVAGAAAAPQEVRDYPVIARFIEQAAQTPDQPAITAGARSWSYGELSRMAQGIAERLRQEGVAPGTTVAIVGPAGAETVAALLAVLSLRAVLVTLDATLPVRRLAHLLAASRCSHVTGRGARPTWTTAPAGAADVRWVELAAAARGTAPLACAAASPDDPAYCFFTSGSTGTPRAVSGTARGLGHFLAWQRERFAVGPGDRCAQVTGFSFDVVLRELFLPLTSGATLVLPPAEVSADPTAMLPWLATAEITLLHAVPSIAERWLATEDHRVPSLRWLFLAGEPLFDVLVHRWREVVPPSCGIVNLYGPTETTLAKCAYVLPAQLEVGLQPVGAPLPGTQVFVLDAARRPCAPGEPGEVVIRTPYRTRGYLDDAATTAARFVPNPWRDDPGDRLYLTGDRGRLRDDGLLEVRGRLDRQVKIHGVRVEPAEVAAALAQHPAVGACTVAGRIGNDGSVGLVGYVVARGGAAVTDAALRVHLAGWLPTAMIPTRFVQLPALPLLPNGKVDVAALPEPEPRGAAAPASFVAPRSSLEELVATLFEETLRVGPVGAHDDFFALGGQSLLAAGIVARLRHILQLELPLAVFFEHPTVSGLARHLTALLGHDSAQRPPPARRPERGARAPLSVGQERLWLLDRLERGSSAYHLPRAYRLRGALRPEVLEASLATVAARHGVMRTRLLLTDRGAEQEVLELTGPWLTTEDLAGLEPAAREAALRRLLTEAARRPFDLTQAPLWRAHLFGLGPHDHVLLLVIHHVIADGWSMNLLAAELSRAYAAWGEGRAPELAPLPLDYLDFAAWQRTLELDGAARERGLDYWRRKLRGHAEELALPVDRPRAPRPPGPAGRVTRVLPAELVAALRACARGQDATLFIVLLAAFKVLLGRYAATDDVIVGCPVAGRSHVEWEPLIGLFTTTLVLRTDLAGDPTFGELVARVRRTLLEAHTHHEVPFERLVEELRPARHLGRNPIFQVMFALHNLGAQPLALGALEVERLENELGAAKFDWFVALHERGDALHAVVEYDTALFDAATLERMLEHFETVLRDAAARPGQRIGELRLLGPGDEACIAAANRTQRAVPAACLHELFVQQVRRAPAAPALLDEAGALSYAELEQAANRLARHLQHLGVGPEVTVGVCLERSRELVVALLGVLQAGGAYVPLDPSYPRERLDFMLRDSRARVLVTGGARPPLQPPAGVARVALDQDAAVLAAYPDTAPASGATPAALAHIIYTSGSTGRPKGVEGIHRATVNRLAWMWHDLPFGPREVCCLKTTIGFVDAIAELFGPLLGGVPSVIVPTAAARDPRALVELLARTRVTRLTLVPSLLETLLALYPDLAARLPDLTLWVVSGEPLRATLRDDFVRLLPGARLLNIYGTTEVTADATWAEVSAQSGPVAIGRPLANLTAHVLDAAGRAVPLGIPGELYIGGVGVARGYRDRPELTAEQFVVDPAGRGRLYRTGDRAKWRPDGELLLLGRRDDQIQIRGQRVELGEVRRQLAALPGVAEAAVVARADRLGELRLLAYVVCPAGADEAALRQALALTLPAFMLPAAIVPLARLPRLPNGKLDRQALPEPAPPARPGPEVALTPRQEALAGIFAELLGLERVGLHDSFFDRGGHSLLAVRLLATVEARLGQRLELAALFRTPTVAGLDAGLVEPAAAPPAALVPLGGSDSPALVLVHALGGDLLCYHELVAALRTKHAVFGLQAPGVAPGSPPSGRLEELAARYVSALAGVTQPLVLAGWSLGGVIAFELARRLAAAAAGRAPVRLVLLDSWRRGGPGPIDQVDDPAQRALRTYLREALRAFRPAPWAGPVVLVRAADEAHPDGGDASLGWAELCGDRLEVRRTPGTHHTMLRAPHVERLATTMQALLAPPCHP